LVGYPDNGNGNRVTGNNGLPWKAAVVTTGIHPLFRNSAQVKIPSGLEGFCGLCSDPGAGR